MNRKFLIWWISVLLTATIAFWSYHFGFIQTIWATDITMITSLITIIFIFTNISLGWVAYKMGKASYVMMNKKKLLKKLDTCWFVSEQLMALGMLGTVIGLIHMLANNFIGVSLDGSMQDLLGNMWKAMGLALYTNAVGLVFSIILKVQVYFVGNDLDET